MDPVNTDVYFLPAFVCFEQLKGGRNNFVRDFMTFFCLFSDVVFSQKKGEKTLFFSVRELTPKSWWTPKCLCLPE